MNLEVEVLIGGVIFCKIPLRLNPIMNQNKD